MKIKVIQENGVEETLTLTGSWRAREGKEFNRLVGPNGFIHFFTSTGEYEGWGNKIFQKPERAGAAGEAARREAESRH